MVNCHRNAALYSARTGFYPFEATRIVSAVVHIRLNYCFEAKH